MSEEYDEAQAGEDSMVGPGAPTPLTALEVCATRLMVISCPADN